MMGRTALGWGAASLLLMACATEEPFREAPKPGPGQALVYVYRLDSWPVVRSDALFDVNGKRMAALRANTYTWFTGHRFSASEGSTNYLRLNVEGETMQMKWWLSTVPSAAAAGEIARCGFLPAGK